MSLLSELKPARGSKASRKRVGRGSGSGRGGTSTRGHKGQRARSSMDIPPGFEGGQMPLHRRSPKWGFNNSRFRKDYQVVNLNKIAERFGEGEAVTPDRLVEFGLVRDRSLPVKILGVGELKKPLKLEAHAFSQSAKKKVEALKGELTELPWKSRRSKG